MKEQIEFKQDNTRREITALAPWFHNLHLPDGSETVPDHFLGDFPAFKWREIASHLPENLQGWSALDIGCNAGFYSFELARMGAEVTAIDVNSKYLAQAEWAAKTYGFGNRIKLKKMQVYDLAKYRKKYDIVLFLGVFYHLRYPLLGLDIVSRTVKKMMVFQTLTIPGEEVCTDTLDRDINDREALLEPGWPKMAFIEHSICGDPTNWWAANHSGIEAMLRSSGLKVISRPGHEFYICEPDHDNPSCIATWNKDEFRSVAGLKKKK